MSTDDFSYLNGLAYFCRDNYKQWIVVYHHFYVSTLIFHERVEKNNSDQMEWFKVWIRRIATSNLVLWEDEPTLIIFTLSQKNIWIKPFNWENKLIQNQSKKVMLFLILLFLLIWRPDSFNFSLVTMFVTSE